MGQDKPLKWKALETVRLGLKFGWGRALGNHRSGAHSVSQVDGDSDVAPTCWLCGSVGGGIVKGTMASASTSVWEKAAPQLSP